MTASNPRTITPADIDARQDAVLRQLEELDHRIMLTLAEHGVVVPELAALLAASATATAIAASPGELPLAPRLAELPEAAQAAPDSTPDSGADESIRRRDAA